MSIETANYITQLNELFPEDTSELANGAQHIRLIKRVLTRSFPLFTTAFIPTSASINSFINLFTIDAPNAKITFIDRELVNIGISTTPSSVNPISHYRSRYISPNKSISSNLSIPLNESLNNGVVDIVGVVSTGNVGTQLSQSHMAISATEVEIIATNSVVISGNPSLNVMYPIGSIYENGSSTVNPGTLLGFGTWVLHGAERVGVCQDTNDSSFVVLSQTGGAWTHALTINEIPSHSHRVNTGPNTSGFPFSLSYRGGYWGSNINYYSSTSYIESNVTHQGNNYNSGAGNPVAPHNNTQKSIVCARWRRTA